jgi:hypothetical protein
MSNNKETAKWLFQMLHPDYAMLSEEEQQVLKYERAYIEENTSNILIEFSRYLNNPKFTESQILSFVVNKGRCNAILTELFDNIFEEPYWLGLEQNISEFDRYRYQYEKSGSENPLGSAVKRLWAENIFNVLHPDYDQLSAEQQLMLSGDFTFILEHVEELEKRSDEIYNNSNREISGENTIRLAFTECRGDDIFKQLHSDYDRLSDEDKFFLEDEKQHILGNLSKIQSLQPTYEKNGIDSTKALRMAVNYTRANDIFDMLHPELESLTPGEQLLIEDERSFILDHVQEIGILKQQTILSNPQMSPQEALRSAVDQIMITTSVKKV